MPAENASADLIWEICNGQNALLVKRKQAGGVMFSRDPLNLMNKHSRKYEGFVNDKAIGLNPSARSAGAVTLTTKLPSASTQPKSGVKQRSFKSSAPARKIFRAAATAATADGSRPDLRQAAVARASALKQTGRPKKTVPPAKLRGAKARRAEAKDA